MIALAQPLSRTRNTASLMPVGGALLQRKCSCGGSAGLTGKCDDCEKKKLATGALQKKLTVNEPGDAYEQEADRVAEQVMRMPVPVSAVSQNSTPAISRAATGGGGGAEAPAIVHDVLRSSGQPLDAGTRAFMEPRFGHDFSGVRVHTDARAAESARAVNALAYTVGNNVVFGEGQYAPGSGSGQRLLAHELTHVVQQGGVMSSLPMVQRKCVKGRWKRHYEGCSLPDFVTNMLGIRDKDNPAGGGDTQFALPETTRDRACDRHDECYQTCSIIGRDVCDLRMLKDMLDTCDRSTETPDVKASCRNWAMVYYTGLAGFGGFAYAQRQTQVCACEALGISL